MVRGVCFQPTLQSSALKSRLAHVKLVIMSPAITLRISVLLMMLHGGELYLE